MGSRGASSGVSSGAIGGGRKQLSAVQRIERDSDIAYAQSLQRQVDELQAEMSARNDWSSSRKEAQKQIISGLRKRIEEIDKKWR